MINKLKDIKESLCYDDVLLLPQYSTIKSRFTDVDLSVTLDKKRGITLKLPIISSPMDTITEDVMAITLADIGGLGIIHRYNTIEKQVSLLNNVLVDNKDRLVACAIGISGDYLERAEKLVKEGCRILCLDVAHGHCEQMKIALETLRVLYPDVHLMAGNIATYSGGCDLQRWGADSIRCGVGSGSICSTRIQTGHGQQVLQTIMDCATHYPCCLNVEVPLIADGGIKNSGDMAKALAAGASFAMIGSLFAGTTETPGEIILDKSDKKRKLYRGMASKEAQLEWRGRAASLEGVSTTVPYKGSVLEILSNIDTNLRSAFSYSGAHNINEFWEKSIFVKQTAGGYNESYTHILNRN